MSEVAGEPVRLGRRTVKTAELSRTQTDIWTSQRLHPDLPVANMGTRSRIRGHVDPDRFIRAFDAVVRHCEVLRTVVEGRSLAGDPAAARVLGDPPATTEVIDLPVEQLEGWCAQRIATPIAAATCVYDSVLLRHADDDWTWWLDIHHIATDAWGSALIFEATSAVYGHADGEFDLSDLIVGDFYRDDVVVDGAAKAAADVRGAEQRAAEWATDHQAAGPQPPIELYGPRGPRTTAVRRVRVPFTAEQAEQLEVALTTDYRSISRELGLLAIAAMSTAIAVHRLDGRAAVVLGVPFHHRRSREAKRIVGPLMELYPLTVLIDPAESHRDMFNRVLASITGLLRRARPGESPTTPFEVVLNVLTARYGDFGGMETVSEWMRSGHVDPSHVVRSQIFDYSAPAVTRGPDDLQWELDLNESLSADDAASRFPDHFAAIVAGVVAAPDGRVGGQPIVGSPEATELAKLNPDPEERVGLEPVHEQVRRAAAADPDWIVAEHRGSTLTAGDFDRRADQVAGWLLDAGLERGRAVGLRMARGIDVLIAIHGVLRAGGVFVMLAPDDPPARHDLIAGDADLFVILDELPPPSPQPAGADQPAVSLDDGAYVLYTSGSTGVPKGVPISHRGLDDYLRFAVASYADGGPPVVALHSSLSFDLTITSLFVSFLTGGRVVVFDEEPITALGRIATDDRITWIKATPSQLELFVRLARPGRPLRTIVVGGEAFRRPVAERVAGVCRPGVRIFNEYGPTEAVVGCMIHEWRPEVDTGPDVPIGCAAPGSEIRILDPNLQLTASGSWGELYVRRPGMAQGYLHRPDLSTERFVRLEGDGDDADRPGELWYRTGDRVRVVRPGVTVYGGRMDDQLKVNGIRLEPAEVEAALVGVPGITTALVRVWHPADAHPTLSEAQRCARCGLGIDVPGVELDAERVCSVCRSFDVVEPQTRQWFRTEADLDERLAEVRSRHGGEFDCLHLLSGGKDSTYALYQLVDRGWRVHALTLDNGYISDGAKENIRRTIADLGISHEFATTPAMEEIFRDSLDRYSNVCQGCYKTIYTLGVARAHEMGIPVIVTGLSRGQFFETRLVPHQFEQGRFDPAEIDATVLEARRVYHHTSDAVTELLPEQRVFDDGTVLDEIEFLDFYRYVDVDLAELYRYLETRAPWVRPADTGRSTNCLINVAGIQVHRTERGFHNYAEPYSWDVRLGHKTRDEALEELDDEVDDDEVARLLAEVGYEPKTSGVLTAWYQSADGRDLDPVEIRRHLRERLPEHAVPSAYVRLDDVPMAASAKADPSLLPAPTRFHRHGSVRVAATTPIETRLCEIWSELLGLDGIGVTDDFFDLGGASLEALEAVAAIDEYYGTDLPDAAVFRGRTVRQLAGVVEQALLETSLAGREEIPALPPGRPAPLSPGEEAMLFDYRMAPDVVRYNVTRAYRLAFTADGPAFDVDRFAAAFGDVVMLHGPLHTSYDSQRRPLPVDRALEFAELPAMSRDEFDAVAADHRSRSFDLDDGPLVRVHVSATGPAEYSVLIGLHHIGIDAGTFDVLWDQVARRYDEGRLPALATSYAAHTDWQRRAIGDGSRSHWLERSRQRTPVTRLGLATPQPPEPDGYLSRVTAMSPDALVGHGSTPFAVSMAAAATVLSRYTGSERVALGITASTKDHAASAPLVGYYLNTLPIDLDVRLDGRFGDLVEQATASITDALPHRAYPFASIVRDARAAGLVPPDVSYMLAYEALATPTFPDATADHRILASGVAVADVTFFVQERETSLEVGIEYDGSVVGRADAERMLALFESVLGSGADDPSRMVAGLVDADAGHDIAGPPLGDVATTVLARFMAHVEATPDTPAVTDADGTCRSYRQLAADVERFAAHLDSVLPDRRTGRIGVAMERSTDLVVAMLAALVSGAAYVPLDPDAPPERLQRIAAVAALDAVVTDGAGATGPIDFGAPTVGITAAAGPGSDAGVVDALNERVARIEPDQVAYVIFTSGSTGTPRGVEVSHANLAASNRARQVWYDVAPARFLVTPSIGFDSSLVGLFWPLATGGTVVLAGSDDVRDVDRIGGLIADLDVTHVLMVPSLYRALLDRSPHDLGGLEMVIVAGEPCPAALVDLHEQRLPGVALVNEYGPTEATVWATARRLRSEHGIVAIGGPIPGTTIRCADARLRAVPEGVVGELLISGPGVAAGYLHDVEATAARFVEIDGRRWYRTGDAVRFRNGVAEFVGRLDDQLNIGGNRLEPGEVEAALSSWPEIRDAVVVAALDPPILVAHVEADALDEPALRSALARRLPAGSMPRRFVLHDTLPRTSHGKVDRAAAAELAVPDGTPDRPAPEPTSEGDLVVLLVSVWRTVFARQDIEAGTDFFAVGGDSLAAVQIVTAVGDALGRVVPIAALLSGRTPVGLAAILDDRQLDGARRGDESVAQADESFQAITLQPGHPDGPLVIMTPAWDDIFGYQELARAFPEPYRVVALVYVERPGQAVVTRVDALVPEFVPLAHAQALHRSTVAVLGWSVGGVVAATLADELAGEGIEVGLVALIDTFFPGEERHLWSNRWWKYKSMLRPGAFGEAGRELRVMGVRRVKRLVGRIGRRLLLWSGATLPDEPQRTSVGGFPVEALGHRIEGVVTPMVFYRATTTNPERTLRKWRNVTANIVDVEVPGRHRGFDSIMGAKGVGVIAGDLTRRLGT